MFKVTKRDPSMKISIVVPFVSFFCALAVGGVLLAIAGVNPLNAYISMLRESLGSFYGFTETLVKATPLILTALGLTIAFRMQLWNIGGEGQLAMGAFGATYVALYSGLTNHVLLMICMFAAALMCGGLWGAIAGFLKARLNVNEVITTLLLNYVALSWVDYLVYGPWKDPKGNNFPFTAYFSDGARLTEFFGTRLHSGLILGLVMAVILYVFLEKTIWGYEIKVIGSNPKAADYAGMNSKRQIIMVLFLSGALAGLAGFSEAAGLQHRLQHGIPGGYGYTAVIVAWLGKRHPAGVIIVSLVMGILLVGGEGLQLYHRLSGNLINAYLGLILFFLVIGEYFVTHKVELVKR